MFKIHKSLLLKFCTAAAILSLTGCANDTPFKTEQGIENNIEAATEPTTVQEGKTIEYNIVEPPEGGWTTEEIMNVTYLCDKKVNFPLSIEYLGNDFTLSGYSKSRSKRIITPALLNYKGMALANASVIRSHNETMIYNIVLFPDICEVEDIEPFVINGIKMYDSFEDVLSALGDDYYYMTDDSLLYNDRETNESLYSLFFEDGRLVHINVSFRFEIDLPLYKD